MTARTGSDGDSRQAGRARSERAGPPPVVTIAARYGAGGSVVGPRVAERLNVLFLDRVIDTAVAERTHVSAEVVHTYTEEARAGLGRLLDRLAVVTNPEMSTQQPLEEVPHLQAEVEEFLAEASVDGGVILGRGANFVLREVPGVLCVLLVGPREARARQAMRLRGLDRRSAEHQLDVNDEARLGYVRQHYSRHPEDSTHYHLIIDSTEMALDDVVDLVVRASEARRAQAVSTELGAQEGIDG
jgi:cytidylate kinase